MTQSLFLSFPALIVFAGSCDIFSKTISNRLCIVIALALAVLAVRLAARSLPLAVIFPPPRPELPYGAALALGALFVYPHGPRAAGLVL